MAFCDCQNGSEIDPSAAMGPDTANTGPSDLPHNTVDTGRSKCGSASAVVTVWQGQKTRLQLYVRDTNGQPVDLTYPQGSSESDVSADDIKVGFEVRDRESSRRVRLRKSCRIVDRPTGKCELDLVPADTARLPGSFVAQLLVYGPDGKTVFYATPYWFTVQPSLDSQFTKSHFGPLTIPEIRLVLRDQCAQQNLLLQDLEFDDTQMMACMRHAIDEFNESFQPATRYAMSNFPWRFHWLRATVGYLLEIAAHGYARDHLPYSAGGVSVDDKNKTQTYVAIAKSLISEWRAFIRSKKLELNIAGGYGYMGSSYGRWAYNR